MNLASALITHAMSRPDHPAIEQGNVITSYAQAVEIIGRLAAVLGEQGIKKGNRVGLCLSDTSAHLLLHYAVAWLGATIVPIDFRWKATEKVAVVKAFGCKIVLIEADDETAPLMPSLVFDPNWQNEERPVPAPVDEANLPIVLSLSSGTTGSPTGAMVTHEQLYERFISQWVGMGFNSSDRYLLATPLYFGGGRSFAMSMLAAGATVLVRATDQRDEIIAIVNERDITALFLVPTQLGRLLDAWDGNGIAMPSVRCLVTSGAAIQPDDRRRVIERLTPNLTDYYATSEGGGIAVLLPHEQLTFPDTVGRPAFRVEIQVVDDEDRPLRAGEVGRLRYRGPGVSTQLVDGQGRSTTAEEGGWFSPGDLAQITPRGHVRLVGRIKDVVIRGGVNIYPVEVESVLSGHPEVVEVCVFGMPDRDLGEVVAAAVVKRAGATCSEDDLRAHVKERLASYKTPKLITFVEALPRNPSGKVVRTALKALLGVPDA
ncbi:class I adenylate-forming enzyme family protein [Microvirga antarctica]|uniref:class I adenylate-forming enzyme family protein n=1 Tax=Microvirga antarctica TaxID=2819233 RepID=UPI001B3080C1|nr:class I adenylate-forming enzyme family protein [Microvirga antarctica]